MPPSNPPAVFPDSPLDILPFDDGPDVLSVSDVATGVRAVLESTFDDLTVEGELTNAHLHASGHFYFTLRDDAAALRGVLWRSNASRLAFRPRDGMLVRVRGRVSFYEARGETQIVGQTLTLAGEGGLRQAFEALRKRLEGEGLFDPARKRPLPTYPERIGVVTSLGSAALRDVLAVLARRYPLAEVVVVGVPVQGPDAPEAIAEAIAALSELTEGHPYRPDVLIVGRGGGAAEDLWAFNDEAVVRALAASTIPTVSGVGHETDVTLADFAADRRAATPSMAAELVVPDRREVAALVNGYASTLADGLRHHLTTHRLRLHETALRPAFRGVPNRLREARFDLERLGTRLERAMQGRLESARRELIGRAARLDALDPAGPLQRGFARVDDDAGQAVTSARRLRPGDVLTLRFGDGAVRVRVVDDGPRGGLTNG